MLRATLGAERHHPALAALAPPDDGQPLRQVHVVGAQADDLAGAHAGLDHQPHDGLVAAVDELLALACLDQPGAFVVGQPLDHRGVELGRRQVTQRVGVGQVLLDQPRAEALQRHLP